MTNEEQNKPKASLTMLLPLIPLLVGGLAAWLLPNMLKRDTFYLWIASQPYPILLAVICLSVGLAVTLAWAGIQIAGGQARRASQVRNELDRHEHFNRATLNTIDVGVLACNATGKLLQINGAMAQLFGIRGKPVLGQASAGIFKLYDPETEQELAFEDTPLAKAVAGEDVHDAEILFRADPDNPRLTLCSAKPIVSKAGKKLGALMAAQDITEMRHAQQNLERYAETMQRSGADLQKVAFIAAHNLQEPSRGITSYSQLLEMQYREQLDGDAKEYLGFIVAEAKRLKSQLADLLKYLETGNDLAEPESVSLAKILEQVRADLSSRQTDKDIDYSVHASQLPEVEGYAELLKTLLQHLLDNAIKFNKSSLPTVQIKHQDQGDDHVFRFEDNGIGVAQTDFTKIFELFQTVHPIGTYEGTGLGLAICKKVVTLHGGRIWIEAPQAGGSAICFTLPKEIPTGAIS